MLSVRLVLLSPLFFGEEAFFRCAFPAFPFAEARFDTTEPFTAGRETAGLSCSRAAWFSCIGITGLPSASCRTAGRFTASVLRIPTWTGCFAASVCGAACWTVLTGCAASGRLCGAGLLDALPVDDTSFGAATAAGRSCGCVSVLCTGLTGRSCCGGAGCFAAVRCPSSCTGFAAGAATAGLACMDDCSACFIFFLSEIS